MARISAYWRPGSLEVALELLGRPGAVVIGGGTTLNAFCGPEPVEVVDLQALHLDRIERLGPNGLVVGAAVTLQQLLEDEDVPGVIRDAARRELPSTLRAQATVGGCVGGADRESELLATLLVHDAAVRILGRELEEEIMLGALLPHLPLDAGRIVTAVTIDTRGVSAVARAARTLADKPIVAAAVRLVEGETRLALSGVAEFPVRVDETDELEPFWDYWASGEYRRALAEILSARALEEIS